MVVLFFALVAALFPFAVGPEPNLLQRLAPGVIWVSALLSVLLSLERLFLADYEDGTLELLVIGPLPLELVVLAKTVAHWLSAALPLVAAAPVVSVLYNLSAEAVGWLMLALALGTPSLSLVGAVGASLALGARRGGVLIPIIVLPLYVPTLIFGVMASEAALAGLSAKPYLLFLGAIFLLMLFVAPLAGAAGLRHSME
jgi:heme exporter protein B